MQFTIYLNGSKQVSLFELVDDLLRLLLGRHQDVPGADFLLRGRRLRHGGLGAGADIKGCRDDLRVLAGRNVAHLAGVFHVDRLRSGLLGRSDGDQPAGTLCS